MSNQMSFRWMFGDGSLLSASNPLRWSAYLKPDELCDQLCRETRPIVVEPHGGSRWPPLSPGECLRRLAEPVRQQRVQLALTREQESARAHQAALARLSEFKRAVGEEAAGRTDAFFLRFLQAHWRRIGRTGEGADTSLDARLSLHSSNRMRWLTCSHTRE